MSRLELCYYGASRWAGGLSLLGLLGTLSAGWRESALADLPDLPYRAASTAEMLMLVCVVLGVFVFAILAVLLLPWSDRRGRRWLAFAVGFLAYYRFVFVG